MAKFYIEGIKAGEDEGTTRDVRKVLELMTGTYDDPADIRANGFVPYVVTVSEVADEQKEN